MSVEVGRPRYVRSVNSWWLKSEIWTEKKSRGRREKLEPYPRCEKRNAWKKSGMSSTFSFRSIVPLQLRFLAIYWSAKRGK